MIEIQCYKCCKELDEQGALIFSPPVAEGEVLKFHICRECYLKLLEFLEGATPSPEPKCKYCGLSHKGEGSCLANVYPKPKSSSRLREYCNCKEPQLENVRGYQICVGCHKDYLPSQKPSESEVER